jgi:hypothetical protein
LGWFGVTRKKKKVGHFVMKPQLDALVALAPLLGRVVRDGHRRDEPAFEVDMEPASAKLRCHDARPLPG